MIQASLGVPHADNPQSFLSPRDISLRRDGLKISGLKVPLGSQWLSELERFRFHKDPLATCDVASTLASALRVVQAMEPAGGLVDFTASICKPVSDFIFLKEKPRHLRFIDLPIVIQ